MGPYAGYITQTIVTLFGVCVLAIVVLYAARRMGAGRSRGPIELVGLLPLETRRAIYLVKVGEQVLVVGASEAGFTKLGEVPASSISPEQKAAGPAFSDVLARVLGQGPRGGDERIPPRPSVVSPGSFASPGSVTSRLPESQEVTSPSAELPPPPDASSSLDVSRSPQARSFLLRREGGDA